MKRKLSVILLIFALISALAACTALQLDTDKIRIIDRQDSGGEQTGTGTQDKGKDTEKNKDKGSQKSDLDDKGDMLQEDTEEYIKGIIEERSMEILTAIKNFDMEKLAAAVHPDKGVRFSPYGYVEVDKDLVFTADEVKNLANDSKTYLWGYYDGSGEPITLTFRDYYRRFIYDADFVNADQVGYNKQLGHGNTINNSFEVYKNSIIVEYHFPEIDPKYEGMDWRSLRLVFEKKNDIWYLVGVIHDEWTI